MMGEQLINMTRAEQLFFEKLKSLERKIDEILEEKAFESIEEISLYKAAKLLHLGEAKIIELVESKKLRGISYRDSAHKKRYRFRVADIREYQKKRQTKLPEEREVHRISPAEELAKKIFGGSNGNN